MSSKISLRPFMKCVNYLRLLTGPNENDLATFATIEQQAKESISSEGITVEFVGQLMNLFQQAFDRDHNAFIKDIFFQNQLALRATQANQDYVFELFEAAQATPESQRKQIQLVNIYRNMISDLFDPYLSILVACLQLKEGIFNSFDVANLSAAEFNKYEYAYARLKPTRLFDGYLPIIRNTSSHTGTHGIHYEGNSIIFKKIKRSVQLSIDDVLKISTNQLIGYIQALMDFTQSIDVAINIMGLNIGDVICQTPTLARAFHEELVTSEELPVRHEERLENYRQIWEDDQLTFTEKMQHFRGLYGKACAKELPAKFLRVEGDFLVIAVPWKKLESKDLRHKVNRAAELCQYAILAEMYFHERFSDYITEEITEPGEDTLQVWHKRDDLKLYNEGDANMLDLLQDGKLYQNYIYQPLQVNFEQLNQDNLRSLRRQRKRKDRK